MWRVHIYFWQAFDNYHAIKFQNNPVWKETSLYFSIKKPKEENCLQNINFLQVNSMYDIFKLAIPGKFKCNSICKNAQFTINQRSTISLLKFIEESIYLACAVFTV